MGRVPALLNVINAALVDIWSCRYAGIKINPGRGRISESFLVYCALEKQSATPGPLRAPGVVNMFPVSNFRNLSKQFLMDN